MTKLDLSKQALELLGEVLNAVSDLGGEIADTKSADYRRGLKDKKQIVMAILERFQKAAE